MAGEKRLGRREFLARSAFAAAAFTIVPRRVLGGPGFTAPSDELTKAVIGVGGMGLGHLRYEGSRLLAVCDVDADHLKTALEASGPGVKGYADFREVLARPDIDIVHIATPPHWHALIAVAAAEAGKDIWCEKPMTRTIGEGRRLVEAVQRNGRIFRVNTWFRFQSQFYGFGTTVKPIKKAVQNGLLGWPLKVTVSGATGFDWKFYWSGKTYLPPADRSRPSSITISGSARRRSSPTIRTASTRRSAATGITTAAGWATWACITSIPSSTSSTRTGPSPVEIEADCPQQHPDACGRWRRIRLRYADGCEIILDGENRDAEVPFIEGPAGKLYRGFRSDIPGFREKVAALPDPEPQVTDFSRAVRDAAGRSPSTRRTRHRSCTLVNLAKIAVRLGRPLRFDPAAQRFVGDEEANRLIDEPMRAPWRM